MTPTAADTVRRADVRSLFVGRPGGVSIASEPVDGVLTYTLPGAVGESGEQFLPLLVKVPIDEASALAVQHEARLLVALRRMRLGPIERTIPRHVGMRTFEGLPVAVSSTVPGLPMEHRRWLHTAQPWLVRRDFELASAWLATLQEASCTTRSPSTWGSDVREAVCLRWAGHALLGSALSILDPVVRRLDGCVVERTAVHGDFWHGNLLVDVDHTAVTGVVNWTAGEPEGSPLRDLARFPLRYTVDRRTGPEVALSGRGWYARTVRSYLRDGLTRIGVPEDRWYDVLLVGLAELAAQEHEHAAEERLTLLSRLPAEPQSYAARA